MLRCFSQLDIENQNRAEIAIARPGNKLHDLNLDACILGPMPKLYPKL